MTALFLLITLGLALGKGATLVALACSCALLVHAFWQSGPPSGGVQVAL